jgi:hypothetical protein
MLKAIKRVPNNFPVIINGTTDKYLFKFKVTVENEEYYFEKIVPYCQNCSTTPLRMTEKYFGGYRCNCGKEVDYQVIKDVKSRIITVLEENE